MKFIEASGYKFEVDDVDFKKFGGMKWHAQKIRNKVYCRREFYIEGKRQIMSLHRIVMGAPNGMEVDHKNGNTFDTKRKNLRICTHAQNLFNNRQAPGKSGYKGVWPSHRGDAWVAMIKHMGKRYSLGTFPTAKSAARAWNEAAKKFRGEFACLTKI